ncbi:MAG TPA: outer membrane beta-barrel protein [Opitutaceae bacterium]|nr:outer membrane beta-barrel protein [Opitutaceae bacterium]
MKHSALPRAGLCLLAAVCFAAPYASALLELDRGVLILNTDYGVSYDSNILGQIDNESDTLITFSPMLEYRREGGRGMMSFNIGGSLVHYLKNDERDHEDYRVSGVITVPVTPDSPFSGSVNASYGRATTVNETVADLVTTTALTLGANGGYAFSERLSGNAGVTWGNVENENFGDNETLGLSLGVSLQEFLLRRLPLTLTYSYMTSESTNDPTAMSALDTTSHAFNVGTSGQLTPKISGNVSIGMRSTEDGGSTPGASDDTGLTASSSLTWAYDELTTVSLMLSKSLSVTADNQSTDATSVRLNLNRKLSEQLSASAGVSHTWNSYRAVARDDKLLSFNAGLSYMIRRNWTAGLNYTYTDNSSDNAMSNFSRHVIGATVSARF